MPSADAKFSSDYLPKVQLHAALLALPGVLQRLLGEHKIIASYGWAAKIHPDLWHVPMRDDTGWLQHLIEDPIAQGIVFPGESDFSFEVPDKLLEIMFCHESDIHLNGTDYELLLRFMEAEPFSQMNWQSREEVKKSMS